MWALTNWFMQLASYMTSTKILNLSKPKFPFWKMGTMRLSEILCAKCQVQRGMHHLMQYGSRYFVCMHNTVI